MSQLGKYVQFLVLALFLTGILSSPLAAELGKTVQNSKYQFSIQLPDGWDELEGGTIEEGVDLEVISLSPPTSDEDPFLENMNVVVGDLGGDLDLDKWFEENGKSLGEIIESGDTELNGVKSKWVIFKGEIHDIPLRQKQFYVVNDGKFYVMTFTATVDAYDKYEKVFDEAAHSFKVTIQVPPFAVQTRRPEK